MAYLQKNKKNNLMKLGIVIYSTDTETVWNDFRLKTEYHLSKSFTYCFKYKYGKHNINISRY